MHRLVTTLAVLCFALPAWAGTPDHCPDTRRKIPKAYLIGSSTMGSVLGPMLQGHLKRNWDIEAPRWGKASSGLARPDFHDWPGEMPRLMAKHRPDIVVISLGTNDNQSLFVRRGVWVRMDNDKWEEVYAARVREMLELAAGKDKHRTVIWLGPTAFDGTNARRQGPIINRIVKREVARFGGRAVFIDAYKATTTSSGRVLRRFTPPGESKRVPARTDDGVHLTTEAVRWLLAEPVLKLVRPCVEGEPVEVAKPEPAPEPEPVAEAEPVEAPEEEPAAAEAGAEPATEPAAEPGTRSGEAAPADGEPTRTAGEPREQPEPSEAPSEQPAPAEQPERAAEQTPEPAEPVEPGEPTPVEPAPAERSGADTEDKAAAGG